MNRRRCLQLAQRIDAQLQRSLGEGIDAQRMLDSALYARDVLLVCDAMPGTELQSLASLYRAAAAQGAEAASKAQAAGPRRAPMGISELLNSIFGPITEAPPETEDRTLPLPHPAQRRWRPWGGAKSTAAEHVARTLARRGNEG